MAAEYLSMTEAVDVICLELEEYAVRRDLGLSVQDAAAAIGIPPERAWRFELTICALLSVLADPARKRETAPATTETAPTRKEHHS